MSIPHHHRPAVRLREPPGRERGGASRSAVESRTPGAAGGPSASSRGFATVHAYLVAPPARADLLLDVEQRLRRAALLGETAERVARWRRAGSRVSRRLPRAMVAGVESAERGWLAALDDGRLLASMHDAPADTDRSVARAVSLCEGAPRALASRGRSNARLGTFVPRSPASRRNSSPASARQDRSGRSERCNACARPACPTPTGDGCHGRLRWYPPRRTSATVQSRERELSPSSRLDPARVKHGLDRALVRRA